MKENIKAIGLLLVAVVFASACFYFPMKWKKNALEDVAGKPVSWWTVFVLMSR